MSLRKSRLDTPSGMRRGTRAAGVRRILERLPVPRGCATWLAFHGRRVMEDALHRWQPSAVGGGIDVPVVLELRAELPLCGGGLGFPREIEDFVRRAQLILGGAVAVEAPLHALRLALEDDRHLIHCAVARVAADAAVHVGGVVEINVVGQLVDPRSSGAGGPSAFAPFQAARTALRGAGWWL